MIVIVDEEEVENGKGMLFDSPVSCEHGDEVVEKSSFEVGEVPVSMPSDMPDCIFKIKSVFRCRICPTIICLTEETLRAHLKSKVMESYILFWLFVFMVNDGVFKLWFILHFLSIFGCDCVRKCLFAHTAMHS